MAAASSTPWRPTSSSEFEYNWIDLDAKTHIGTDSVGFAPYNVRVDPDIYTVTARLSFKFGRDAPAAPLK